MLHSTYATLTLNVKKKNLLKQMSGCKVLPQSTFSTLLPLLAAPLVSKQLMRIMRPSRAEMDAGGRVGAAVGEWKLIKPTILAMRESTFRIPVGIVHEGWNGENNVKTVL